jgi:hypothetical protein
MRPAIAFRWITALVDPPIAAFVRIAFSNASRVRIFDSVTFERHLDDADPRHVREYVAPRVDSRNRRVVRQRHAERLGEASHRRRRSHRVAGAGRARHARLGGQKMMHVDLTGFQRFVQLPYGGARTDVLARELAVQHRPAGDDDRRHVAARGAHQQRGRRLVAACEQHDRVDRVAADRLLDVHRREIACQHRRRPQVRFAVREHRKLDREAARLVDAALHVLGEIAKVRVARRQFGPRIADAHDRPAVELVIGNTLVLHPAPVHEAVLVRRAEPLGGAQRGFCCRHRHVLIEARYAAQSRKNFDNLQMTFLSPKISFSTLV